jgi:hypothetical protein
VSDRESGLEVTVEFPERDPVAGIVRQAVEVSQQVAEVHGLAGVIRRGYEGLLVGHEPLEEDSG